MNFSDVIEDVKKLVGLELHSIRPGSNICIIKVDEERSCLILRTATGKNRSRPLSELQTIWDEMNQNLAVHVDEVLHGSGTSRNQPETILANLPYVEWLKIDNKKHIAFVKKPTHPYGTLKPMDSINASKLRDTIKSIPSIVSRQKIIIVATDISETVSYLQKIFSGTIQPFNQGTYIFNSPSISAIILSSNSVPLPPGTYPIIPVTPTSNSTQISIIGKTFYSIDKANLRILTEE